MKKNSKSNKNRKARKAEFVSQQTQTLGAGVAMTVCNGIYKCNTGKDAVGIASIPYIALRTPEFPLYASLYRWYKINHIDITFFPHSYIDTNGGMFFQLQWKLLNSSEDTDLKSDDTSKFVSLVQPTFKTFRFKPPRALITNFQYTTYDFSSWIPCSTSATNLPITMIYQITADNIEFECNIQVNITFRGAQTVDLSRLANDPTFTEPYKKAVARSEQEEKQRKINKKVKMSVNE
jgi:hypothetical protein